jgi:hypothetical protein
MSTLKSIRSSAAVLALAVLVLFSLACSCLSLPTLGSGEAAQPQAGPGAKITMSESLQIKGIPQSVIPYGGGQSVTLTDLNLKKGDKQISGDVRYTSSQQEEFALIVYITMPEQLLVVYFDSTRNEAFTAPAGRGGSNVLLTVPGYKLEGAKNKGTVHFSFFRRGYETYDITGKKGKVFVFCVNPKDQIGNESFQAISNVIEAEMDF